MTIPGRRLIRLMIVLLLWLFSASCASAIKSEPLFGLQRVYRLAAVQVTWMPETDYAQLDRTFDLLRRAGVNTLIFRVFQNPGDRVYGFARPKSDAGVYFKTNRAPLVDDVLKRVADIAHRRGLMIFAWMTTRQAGFDLEKIPQYRCRRYNFQRGAIEDAPGISIFHPEVRNHLLALYRDLARYPIDGILLQDDLILRHNEDFSDAARAAYRKDTGRDLNPMRMYSGFSVDEKGRYRVTGYTREFWTWALWKARMIVRLAGDIGFAARRENHNLRVAMNLMYEAAAFPEKGLCWLSQSLPDAVSIGFDYYAIMAYHRQMERELRKSPQEVRAIVSQMARSSTALVSRPAQILMKLQTIAWKTGEPIPPHELEMVSHAALSAGPVSLALVPYGDHLDPALISTILEDLN
ncbi:MAG: family 10 glycosylhydrolase [Deltaproteobacteria bacterium]|nr:family 10 glycosylhydrolase [Deltaproteobacteria bacterium]MBW2306342.1 family 10 glycosylhydrolase [Deltaproteobacteria bacterium]